MAASIPETYKLMDKCSLCKCEYVNAPKILTCFHSFCNECLEKKMRHHSAGDTLPCPECSMGTIVPVGGVNRLADDFLQETKQKLEKLHDGKVKFCDVCEFIGEEILAFHFCINCQYHLCDRDKKKHKATPSQRDHCVISYEEMTSGKYDPEIIESTLLKCKHHSSESGITKLTFYCKECYVLVCHECILRTHQGHELSSVEEASNDLRRKIVDLLQKVCSVRDNKTAAIKTAQNNIEDLNGKQNKIINEIKHRGEKMTIEINDLMKKITANAKSKFSEEEGKCEKAIEKIKSQDLCLENIRSFIEQFMKYSSDVFVVSHQKDITGNAEVCLKNLQTTPKVQLKSYKFAAHDDSPIEETLKSLFGKLEDQSSESEPKNIGVSTARLAELDKIPKSDTKPSTLLLSHNGGIVKLSQSKLPGIIDVSVTERGDIMVLTPSTLKKLGHHFDRTEDICSSEDGKMCVIQAFKNEIYISLKRSLRSFVICDVKGQISKVNANVPDERLAGISGIGVDSKTGIVYFGADFGKVHRYRLPYNQPALLFAQGLNTPTSMCCDGDGNCIISDRGNHNVTKYNHSGDKQWRYGGKGNGQGQFESPRGVCTDNKGTVYVADHNNKRIHVLSPDGCWLRYISCRDHEDGFSSPVGLHYREGKLYIASNKPDLLTVYEIS